MKLFLIPILSLFALGPATPVVSLEQIAPQVSTENAAGSMEIFFTFPGKGEPLAPVLLIGKNFQEGSVVFFDLLFSPILWMRSVNLPYFGRFSVAITTVPVFSPAASVDLFLKKGLIFGAESNKVDFKVL